jgi:O-methyltransferase
MRIKTNVMLDYVKQFSPNANTRRKAAWNVLSRRAKRSRLQVYRPNLVWPDDVAFAETQARWNVMGMPDDRRFFLFSTAASVRHVEGDTADIGVRFGTSSYFILSGVKDQQKPHHLFDSFEGLSEPTRDDMADGKTTPWSKGDLRVDESVTRKNLAMFPNCHYYKGWIPDRFPDVGDRKFSFVHVDVDLYEPTRDSLAFFYQRVSPRGVIICDDYGFTSCHGARKAVNEFFADKPESIIHVPTGQALIVKA